jgi:hypothetical protein
MCWALDLLAEVFGIGMALDLWHLDVFRDSGTSRIWMSLVTDDPTNSAWISHKSSAFIPYFRAHFAYH